MINVKYEENIDKLTIYTTMDNVRLVSLAASAVIYVDENNIISGYAISNYSKNLINRYFSKFLGQKYNK